MKKIYDMFRPKPKPNFTRIRTDSHFNDKKGLQSSGEEKFKVNAVLLELIKEN